MSTVRTFAESQEVLAASLPGYEARSHQVEFAEAVEKAIANKRHLMAEAGTGTGKSLGYLIPSILSGKRVIVSTATKALQDQVWSKDLPFLAEHLGVRFTSAILKGRSNYICVNKLQDTDPSDVPSAVRLRDLVLDEFGSINEDFSGEREDLPFEIETREWMKISADSDDCKVLDCKDNGQCYAEQARRKARDAKVVVVNHALYLTDLLILEVSGGAASFLGEHDVVVFDESHEIEEYAGNTLGSTFKEVGIRHLLSEVRNFSRAHSDILSQGQFDDTLRDVTRAMDALWAVLEVGRIRQPDLVAHADEFVNFANSLEDLSDMVTLNLEGPTKRRKRIEAKVLSASRRFNEIVTRDFTDLVRWVEIEKERPVLKTAPVSVAPFLREWLFKNGPTAILVSATLSVNGSFGYIAGRLGVDNYDGLDVGTPFDYQAQAATFVPSYLPDPSREREAWSAMSINEMLELVRLSEGRALLLFTSYSEMRAAYNTISSRVPYTCLMQGEASNKVLAAEFAADEHSVLFATRSFMTGVDFQGDTLKLVVINKLPFPVPTEPLIEARCEAIKARGGSDFQEYTIPVMSLILKQAYGRLIRHRNDTGVVAILDPRLQTKGYGKQILRSLPDAPVVTEISLVEARLSTPEPGSGADLMVCFTCKKEIIEERGEWVHVDPFDPEQPFYCYPDDLGNYAVAEPEI